jgi:hypothetical protein
MLAMIAYKLVRMGRDGQLYPLYVNSTQPFVIGEWMYAEPGPMTENGKVKSKLGQLAYRPGFHCSDIPYATHIGKKGADGKIAFMNADHVWVEVEIDDTIDYQEEANRNGINPRTGRLNPRDADLDHVPVNGYYRYKTNPNMTGEWIIAGSMRINRVLDDEEVRAICARHGYVPLPRATARSKSVKMRRPLFNLRRLFRRR